MIKGKVWKYKDNINTDIIAPPASLELCTEEAARYTMAPVDPDFASGFKPGDIFVAEHNLGSGSSRENAPLMLRQLGVRTIVAMDYDRIFFRNCINVGILTIECPETNKISRDDVLEIDYLGGMIYNRTTGEEYRCNRIPEHVMGIIRCGGLIEYLKQEKLPGRR